jgi:hypothetical protein
MSQIEMNEKLFVVGDRLVFSLPRPEAVITNMKEG